MATTRGHAALSSLLVLAVLASVCLCQIEGDTATDQRVAPASSTPAADSGSAALPAPTQPTSVSETPAAASTPAPPALPGAGIPGCPEYIDTQRYRTTNFTDYLNTTVSISPGRPPTDVATGQWIQGRATFYGADERLEASRVACGEPPGQYGVIAQGSCGYTNSDGSLPFPREVYAAVADTNEDYPGSCGRCYQVRCRTGPVYNNGRELRVSDLIYGRPYQIKDNFGRDWPGNPRETEDVVFTQCWDDDKTITVRVGDSCPCKYPIKEIGEIRTQNWCCGGNNHFDLSFWGFEQLAHPTYGVIPIEYRPVDCDTEQPLKPVPGFVSQTIFSDSIQPGWNWLPYNAKNTVLLAAGEGVGGSVGTCATLSEGGAVKFYCRECSRSGYQPFAKAASLQFDIRSNTQSTDEFASSTPPGALPPLKLFMMNSEASTYCGAEVVLTSAAANATLTTGAEYATPLAGDWYRVTIPLSAWACAQGSVGGLTGVDRVDFQNVNLRDADICLDNIALV